MHEATDTSRRAAFSTWGSRIAPVFEVAQEVLVVEADGDRILQEAHESLQPTYLFRPCSGSWSSRSERSSAARSRARRLPSSKRTASRSDRSWPASYARSSWRGSRASSTGAPSACLAAAADTAALAAAGDRRRRARPRSGEEVEGRRAGRCARRVRRRARLHPAPCAAAAAAAEGGDAELEPDIHLPKVEARSSCRHTSTSATRAVYDSNGPSPWWNQPWRNVRIAGDGFTDW
jgi:hypothetical protein